MLIGIFKSNQRTINVFIVVIAIILWGPSFFAENEVVISKYALFSRFNNNLEWLNNIIAILLICGQAIYLNYIANEFKLVNNNTHLTSLMYVILNGASIPLLIINPVLVVNCIVLIVIHQLLLMYNLKRVYDLSFNAGLFIGLGSLIYFPLIIFFPIVWITLIYTKTVVWRELVISVLGIIIPFIYMLVFYFISDQVALFRINSLTDTYFIQDYRNWSINNWSYFGIIGTLIFWGGIFFIFIMNSSVVKVRKHMMLILLILIAFATTIFINKNDYLLAYILLTVPAAIILANFFNEVKKKWLSELIFLMLIGSIIIGYFS